MAPTLRLGLTGGIGSGKSTVACFLRQRGAAIIDADAISRSLTAVDGLAIEAISLEFGPSFIAPNGALDRNAMRKLVYTDADARRRLEAIIHPLVVLEAWRHASDAVECGRPCIVFDMPLLVESGHWRSKVDRVIVVDCTSEVQIERVMSRNGLAREAVEKIIASQTGRENRLRAADWVIHNMGLSLQQLAIEVGEIPLHFGL
ncbi:MAG: hypothetical protein RL211_2147 [Pseudomonadota bacterium]|jgi:dephospho-CoA kinase